MFDLKEVIFLVIFIAILLAPFIHAALISKKKEIGLTTKSKEESEV